MESNPVVIVGARRTPIGAFQGALASLSASDLGAVAMSGALAHAGLDPAAVDEALMGCVLQAGQGQAPARQAALKAGLATATACTTIHKVCGSGMKAAMIGHDALMAASCRRVVCGGMESMSQAPYLLPKVRHGLRLGHGQILDHLFLDGLEDAYRDEHRGRLMGTFADDCARRYGFTRSEQDEYARTSTQRALAACQEGAFVAEMAPVTVPRREGSECVGVDETPFKVRLEAIASLRPAFAPDGTVTAANASSISDGAAALVLMRAAEAQARGLTPLARIVAHASYAGEPALFPTAPAQAILALFARCGWQAGDVDLFEINEAFAVVVLAAMRELSLDPQRVNIHGGACALGHPIGATGARILVTLVHALRRHGLRRGVASLCIGGGEATAMAVEVPD